MYKELNLSAKERSETQPQKCTNGSRQGPWLAAAFDGEMALGFVTAASPGAAYDGWVVTEVELRIKPDDGTGANRTATPPGLAICESDSCSSLRLAHAARQQRRERGGQRQQQGSRTRGQPSALGRSILAHSCYALMPRQRILMILSK